MPLLPPVINAIFPSSLPTTFSFVIVISLSFAGVLDQNPQLSELACSTPGILLDREAGCCRSSRADSAYAPIVGRNISVYTRL
jgi:hypothetical protein